MSGPQVRHSNPNSRLNHPNNVSFLVQTPHCSQDPVTRANSLKPPCTSSGLDFSSCSSSSEQSNGSSSPLPVRRVCMGRPYSSRFVETSHLANRPKVAKKPDCRESLHCLLCTDGPSDHSSPTFLDQLIRGINYLDRSTNCPKSLSLPRLAANYLERAANSIYLDHPDHSSPCSYPNPGTSMVASHNTSTRMVPSTKGVHALQCVDNTINTSCSRRLHSQDVTPMLPQGPGIKLPELPLFGNGIFSLGRLPKLWEAIRTGWNAPLEPMSKPCNWW